MPEQKPKKLVGFSAEKISERVAKEAILMAYECEKISGQELLKADEYKNKAYKYLTNKNLKHLDVEAADKTIRFQSAERTNVTYFLDKLKQSLSMPVLREVVMKKYEVKDIELLKATMQKYNVPADILKDCLSITETVDRTRMDELFKAGHITIEQLEGCYKLSTSTSLTLKELDNK